MTSDRFDIVHGRIKVPEGGFQNDKYDSGNWVNGENRGTNHGISAAQYPNLSIKDMTAEEAKGLLRTDYWDKIQGNRLGPGLDQMVMDIAVNAGTAEAARFLQRALGLKADGRIGDKTIDAVHWLTDDQKSSVINNLDAQRRSAWRSDRRWERYKNGWTDRGDTILAHSLQDVKDDAPVMPQIRKSMPELALYERDARGSRYFDEVKDKGYVSGSSSRKHDFDIEQNAIDMYAFPSDEDLNSFQRGGRILPADAFRKQKYKPIEQRTPLYTEDFGLRGGDSIVDLIFKR